MGSFQYFENAKIRKGLKNKIIQFSRSFLFISAKKIMNVVKKQNKILFMFCPI